MAEEKTFSLADEDAQAELAAVIERSADEAGERFGSPFYYIKKEVAGVDNVFGEHNDNIYKKGIKFNAMLDEQNHEDDYELVFAKFGVNMGSADTIIWAVKNTLAKKGIIPREGDLIYYVRFDDLYEITSVALVSEGVQWKITVQYFNYDHTKMEDDMEEELPDIKALDTKVEEYEQVKFFSEIKKEADNFLDNTEEDAW